MKNESYSHHVEALEQGLAVYAKRSFEPMSPLFLDGGEIYEYFSKQWEDSDKRTRLLKRTPLQIERDRIIHTTINRKLTEKYQVLYSGQRKVIRNYATHVNRLVQVTRALCRWLDLNSDFAEAIALGSKTGALPFVHASKDAVSSWVKKKLAEIDKEFSDRDPDANSSPLKQLALSFGGVRLPSWVENLRSPRIVEKVVKFLPWAAGVENAYSTGQQGYWMLATNPFTVESRPNAYCPETMHGIWRHTLGAPVGKDTFAHRVQLSGAVGGKHEITWRHVTYEGIAVSYADDITWAIENLNDANTAALLNGNGGIYAALLNELHGDEIPDGLMRALAKGDAGALYAYFIADFSAHSERVLRKLSDGSRNRSALQEGMVDAPIGLSEDGMNQLHRIKSFLDAQVFSELRVANRTQMLRTLSEACMEILYRGVDDIVPRYIRDKANIDRWPEAKRDEAIKLARDPVHRVQLAVDIFCEMGDQEIYDLVGIESL